MPAYYCLLTLTGQAKIAAAIAAGTQVNATQIAVGDGNGNDTTPANTQTALVREVYRTNVSSISVNPADNTQVIFEAVIAATVGGWTARELGLYDNTGALLAIANIGSVYKPTASEGSAREMVVRIYAQVSQISAINLVVDPSFYIATRSWVQANFSLGALLPGGTTGQILRKKSNADGDTEWVNPLSAQNITVNVVEENQTLAAAQTVVNLATATTAGLAVYVEGVRLRSAQYTVNTNTQFTLAQSYPAGSRLIAVQNDPAAALDYLRRTNNLSELSNAATARTNLGLGTMATAAAADYVAKSGSTMTGVLVAPEVQATNTAKAWVNFNGSGTVAMRASFNVSSVTDMGTGKYLVNFATPMSDANYAYSMTADSSTGHLGVVTQYWPTPPTTSSIFLQTCDNSAVPVDSQRVCVIIFR